MKINQEPNIFIISYQGKKEYDNVIKEAVYQGLHKISKCCNTRFDSVWLHICVMLKNTFNRRFMCCIHMIAPFPLPLTSTVQHFLHYKKNASMEKINNQF